MKITLKADLERARALIADEEHWTTQFHAIENTGAPMDNPWSRDAYAWCADGAIAKVCQVRNWERTGSRYQAVYDAVNRATKGLFGCEHSIVDVNDGELDDAAYGIEEGGGYSNEECLSAYHRAVLRVFDKAIEEAA
jgi:hypothetical protein